MKTRIIYGQLGSLAALASSPRRLSMFVRTCCGVSAPVNMDTISLPISIHCGFTYLTEVWYTTPRLVLASKKACWKGSNLLFIPGKGRVGLLGSLSTRYCRLSGCVKKFKNCFASSICLDPVQINMDGPAGLVFKT